MPKDLKGAVRVNALTLGGSGTKSLPGMEDHGKRQDAISQHRAVSRRRPLVYRTLDLRAAYEHHVDGAKMNAAATKPVLHMIVQYPDMSGPGAPAPFREAKNARARQQLMLDQAVRFANESHGGNAVFAGRVDRDEKGQWTVDLFLAPRYEKITKTGKSSGEWVSTTKFGKELAEKHQDYIRSRHTDAKGKLTGPRHVGIALQAEFREFFERENGVALVFTEKDHHEPDRLEPEAFAVAKMRAEAAEAEVRAREAAQLAREAEARRMVEEEKAEEAERQRASAEALAAEEAVRRQRAEADATAAQQRRIDAEKAADEAHRKAHQERLAALAAIEARKKADEDTKAAREAAAAKFRAQGAAFESLARQFEAGELSWTSDGRIRAADVETLKAGMPTIGPALQAMVSLHEEVAGMRKEAAQDRAAAAAERKAAAEDRVMISEALQEIRQHQAFFKGVRQRLSDGMKRLADWLKRPDLSGPARSVGEKLNGDLDDLMREEIEAGTVIGRLLSQTQDKGLSTEKPREEPDGLGLDR